MTFKATFVHGNNQHKIDHTPSAAVAAGDVVMIGTTPCVALVPIPANKLDAVIFPNGGATFDFLKDTSTFATGDDVYWDDTVKAATSGTVGTYYLGKAIAAAATGDATVRVVHDRAATVTAAQALVNTIADPGASGAIPITASGHVDIVTAAAETRTLAAPSFVGQLLQINLKTDGGDCAITCATTVNQTGNNTITLNDAGDSVLLAAKANGTNKHWSVVANDGATLSTV